ncbi:mediator-associated protein 2-like [Macadamia integrifolia]|uniref:mediator-associated protein 2-like n=1 Tax=Macadamia integrifolia TaxID=60698 RepID=UPI001C4FF171|nr:mediator-associated protein 2-like [Macadamia integrifolia]XP_042482291.1 mediator-associated protein 2-like [Macadamia integrifolia]
MSTMEEGYKPPAEFQVDAKDPLVDISLTDSTELWLIQWPINQPPDYDGQELSLKLHHDGQFGSFESSSGKSYKLVSFAAQEPDATVFLSSPSESKVVGKISRRVSLVHYPEPTELEKPVSNYPSQLSQRSGTSSYSSHPMATPSNGRKQRSPHSRSGMSHSIATPSVSSRQKNSLIESEVTSRSAKKRTVESTTASMDRSTRDSGAGRSDVTSLGSENSHQRKSRKIIKEEQ